MAKYKHGTGGKWFQLSLPPHCNRFACCDCGLTHEYEFKIVPTTRGKGLTIWCRIKRADRATATVRRFKKELYRTRDGWYVVAFPIRRKSSVKSKR